MLNAGCNWVYNIWNLGEKKEVALCIYMCKYQVLTVRKVWIFHFTSYTSELFKIQQKCMTILLVRLKTIH